MRRVGVTEEPTAWAEPCMATETPSGADTLSMETDMSPGRGAVPPKENVTGKETTPVA